jgi:predicted metal-dependent peptidase
MTKVTVTAVEKAAALNNIRKARVKLVLHQPFLASIVLKRTIELDDDVPTAYCTAGGKIVCGTRFVSKLTVAQTVFLLAHEAMHYAMMHHIRRGWRKPRPANIAMDKVINDILVASKCGDPIPEGVFQAGAREFAWEQLYDEQGEEGGDDGPYEPGNGNDDLSPEGINDVDEEQIAEIRRELIDARTAAKKEGNMPAGLEKLVEDIVNPKTPWYQLTERFMLQLIKAGVSWRRPNKKYMAQDDEIYLPSYDKEPRMGTLVIQSDESGSIDVVTTTHWNGHINALIEACKPERVIVLHTDTVVAKAEEFEADDLPIVFKTYAGGGTDMTAGFKWCEDNAVTPDVFVCLTDGYTPFGEPQDYPVLWLITTEDVAAPHGETIFYDVNLEG